MRERTRVWDYLSKIIIKDDNEHFYNNSYTDKFIDDVTRMAQLTTVYRSRYTVALATEEVRQEIDNLILNNSDKLQEIARDKDVVKWEIIRFIKYRKEDTSDNYYIIVRIHGVVYGSILCYHTPGNDFLKMRYISKSWAGIVTELIWKEQFPSL